jgi:hypothetical protein
MPAAAIHALAIEDPMGIVAHVEGDADALADAVCEGSSTCACETNTTDPATRQPYRYERINADTYTLTATFDLPSPPEQEQPAWNRDGFFKHRAGEQSFRLSAPKQPKP